MRYLIFFCLFLAGVSIHAAQPLLSENNICPSVAGEYEFWGVTESGINISFLQRLARPSQKGFRWVKIIESDEVGVLNFSFLSETGGKIGDEIRLSCSCFQGKWEIRNSFKGNSDGTYVKGERIWKFYRGGDDKLVIEFSEESVSEYFPGISASPRSTRGTSYFLQR